MNSTLVEGVNIGKLDDTIFEEVKKNKSNFAVCRKSEQNSELYDLITKSDTFLKKINIGDVITGTISRILDREIRVSFNYKDDIYIDNRKAEKDILDDINIGDTIDVLVTEISNDPYEIKGSIVELLRINANTKINDIFETNGFVTGYIKEMIPAGFILDLKVDNIKVDAFMPNTLAGVNRLSKDQTNSLLGQTVDVMLESFKPERGLYVVSRKKYLETYVIPEKIKNLKHNIVYTGIITGTRDYGIFVEFDDIPSSTSRCLTGMIHKLNINKEFQDKLLDLRMGTEIDFYVKDIMKNDRIILTQILRETTWDKIKLGEILPGTIVEGTVIENKNFGTLIQLDEETIGLIQKQDRANTTLNVGDKIPVVITDIISDEKKIYLKQVQN